MCRFIPRSQRQSSKGQGSKRGVAHSTKKSSQQSQHVFDNDEAEEDALISSFHSRGHQEEYEDQSTSSSAAAAAAAETTRTQGRMDWMKQPFSFDDMASKSSNKRNREEEKAPESEREKKAREIIDEEVKSGKRHPQSKLPYGLYNPSKKSNSDGGTEGVASNASSTGGSDDTQSSFGMQLLMKGAKAKTSKGYDGTTAFGSGMTTGGQVASSSSQQRLNLKQASQGEAKLSESLLSSALDKNDKNDREDSSDGPFFAGDGGVFYKLKAIRRVKDEAERTHEKLETVAEKRWGSIDKLTEGLSDNQVRLALSDKPLRPPCRDKGGNSKKDNRNADFNNLIDQASGRNAETKGGKGSASSQPNWRSKQSKTYSHHNTSKLVWEEGSLKKEPKPKRSWQEKEEKTEGKSVDPLFEQALRKEEEKRKERQKIQQHTDFNNASPVPGKRDQVEPPNRANSDSKRGNSLRTNSDTKSGQSILENVTDNDDREKATHTLKRNETARVAQETPTSSHNSPTTIDEATLNKLHAKAMRAKMKGKHEQCESLMKQIADVRAGQSSANQGGALQQGEEQNNVEVVAPFDEYGRPIQSLRESKVEGFTRDDTRGGRKKGKVHGHGKANLKNEKGETMGHFVADAREAKEKGLSDDGARSSGNSGDIQREVAQMARQEKDIGRQGMDEHFVKNMKRLGKHFKGEGIGLATGKGANATSMSREGTGIDEDEDINTKMFEPEEERLTLREKQQRDKARAVKAHRKMESIHRQCNFCLDSDKMKNRRHLIIAIGDHNIILLPPVSFYFFLCFCYVLWNACLLSFGNFQWRQLAKGHCIIAPREHILSYVEADENAYDEANSFRSALYKAFSSKVRKGLCRLLYRSCICKSGLRTCRKSQRNQFSWKHPCSATRTCTLLWKQFLFQEK